LGPYYGSGGAPALAIGAIWGGWLVSWMIAAAWASRTANRPPVGSQVLYRLITFAAFVLLLGQVDAYSEPALWATPLALGWAMAALTAAGFGFCWWARLYLGRLWSGSVTRKEDHHIVDTGPYALVRHPIYTGIIVASAATAIARGTPTAFIGLGLMILGCWIKAKLEESFLRSELGAAHYDAYASRTGMLLPFL
jgi:protein-S-isoprenylcysteine O-methyltransferase Ste14